MTDSKYVFVYGSLRKGRGLSGVMSIALNDLGVYKSKRKYNMYNLGAFPCITKNGNTQIVGEVYEIDSDLEKRLDAIEGVPTLYYKDSIELEGFDKPVYAYFMKSKEVQGLRIKDNGDWLS